MKDQITLEMDIININDTQSHDPIIPEMDIINRRFLNFGAVNKRGAGV